MIGIGVTGCNRPEHVQLTIDQIEKYTQSPYKLHVSIDTEKKGVAWNKNQCLEALKDCDHIFLFDDDAFPRAQEWELFFIEAAQMANIGHFIYQHETIDVRLIKAIEPNIGIYNNSNGCMMYFTRECLDKVGVFDEKFGVYGFEHADMSMRAHLEGCSPSPFVCPLGAAQYIYSLDIDNYLQYEIEHRPTLFPNEIKQAVEVSRERWQQKVEQSKNDQQ